MRDRACFVVPFRVGRKLAATLHTAPFFRGFDERRAHSSSAHVRLDIPTFQIRHAIGLAPLRIMPNRKFDKAEGMIIRIKRDERFLQNFFFLRKKCCNLNRVLFFRGGPKFLAHAFPHCGVAELYWADEHKSIQMGLRW